MQASSDLVGYGRKPPHARWPGDPHIAINYALNYEEGSELAVGCGDERCDMGLPEASGDCLRKAHLGL